MRWALAFAAVGCSVADERQIVFPPNEGALSLVLAIETAGRITDAEAITLEPRPPSLRLPRLVETDSSLHALLYSTTLDELGLDEGPIARGVGGDGRVLPEAPDHYVVRIAETDFGWIPSPEPGAIGDFSAAYRFRDLFALCDTFEVTHLPVPTAADWSGSLRIDDRSVLLLTEDDEQFVLTATAVRRIDVRAVGMRPLGVTIASGELFYGAVGGIWRGGFLDAGTIEAREAVAMQASPRWLAARTSPFEIVTLDNRGRLHYVDSEGPAAIDQVDLSATQGFDIASVAMGDDDALVVADALFGEAIHVRAGVATRERHSFDGTASLLSVHYVPGYGYVAGTSEGQVAHRTLDDRWEALPSTGFRLNIRALESFENGIVYAGANGGFGQYVFDQKDNFCEVSFPVGGTLRGAHTLGSRIMLIQKILSNEIAILDPR